MQTIPVPVYAGVDVAKASLQLHLQGRQAEFTNQPAGLVQLCQQLKTIPHVHVVCEATGGYERLLVQTLHRAQIPVSVTNPAQVRAAAQAQGKRAKTDRIDAALLTDYGQRYQPKPTPPTSSHQDQLVALTQWLTQLIQAQALAKTQAEHHEAAFVGKQHAKLMAHYESQVVSVEKQIRALLAQDAQLQQRVDCLDQIKGVGPRTAWLVLAHLPELGQINRQEVAALAGLAPWTRESGTMKGIRCIGGGRPEVRLALYMPALSASRCNPVLQPLYQRLRAKEKPAKVALTAVMRRLLVYMNHQLKALAAAHAAAKTENHKSGKTR
jgi:transposase